MNHIKPIILLALFVSISCATNAQNLTELKWLAGNWISKTEKLTTIESWSIRNDSTMVGTSETRNEVNELTFEEVLKIETRLDRTSYIALLPTKIAQFQTELISKSKAIFTDTENDFPSKIKYLKTKNGIQIVLEGKGNKQVMNFVRKAK